MKQIHTPVLLALVLLLAGAPALGFTWFEQYERGNLLLQQREWEEAVKWFDAAISGRPEPGQNIRTEKGLLVNYLPYLKLGIAYFNMGEYEKALQAFDSEESYGVVSKSESDLKNLQTLRELARVELMRPASAEKGEKLYSFVETIVTRNADGEEREIQARYFITGDELVQKSLEAARAREAEGRLEEAVSALGPGLAVLPDHGGLKAAMKRLQGKIAEREEQSKVRKLVEEKLGRAREVLDLGAFETASSVLQEAAALDPDNAEVKSLLESTRTRLREKIEAERSAEAARRMIRKGLEEAADLEKAGRLSQAVEKLQVVLAMDPMNAGAMEMQARLIERLNQRAAQQARRAELGRLLQESTSLIRQGQHARALNPLNRLISLDPGNRRAQTLMAGVFAAINKDLLASAADVSAPKLPPVIALANTATLAEAGAGGDGAPEERVTHADFILSGIILDDRPDLKLTFMADEGGPGPEDLTGKRSVALPGEQAGNLYRYTFAEPFRLASGLSMVRIIASDADGLSAEVVHRVRYVPPLWRSPWLYGGTGALLAAALGMAQASRIRRRGRLRKRGFNPYVAGAPVLSEELFMGREQLLSRVLRSVHNNSILLFGERRIGKTSLQHHLRKRLRQLRDEEYEFFPVYIDLQGTPQERFFATMAADVFEGLAPELGDLRPSPALAAGEGYDYDQFVRDMRKVLKALRARSRRAVKLVLLIDEVDELNDYNPKINQKLRSLFMKSFAEEMVAVVSGVGIKKHWESEGSPWYNFFEEIEVRPFSREDAEELIRRPIKGVFGIEDGVVDRIIEYTDCKPYLIQKLCISLVNRLYERNSKRITLLDVESVGRPQAE